MKMVFVLFFFCLPLCVSAQEVHQDLKEIVEAHVVEIVSEQERDVHGTDLTVSIQNVRAQIQSGSRAGDSVVFENELVPVQAGDVIYLNYVQTIDGTEYFMFKDFKRQPALLALGGLFILVLLIFSGTQGLRSLLSLALSACAILFLLIPALLAGYNPALVSLGIAGLILGFVLFLTHGVNPRSATAFVGTFLAVLVTCALAWFWVRVMHLTGFGNDEAVYLNFATNGTLDFTGLLLGGIIIGVLGVLDDVAITQASVVQELKQANKTLSVIDLYQHAIRVGKDHVGSLVNTLAFAYVGVALPLMLLIINADADMWLSLNQEIVAAELVRIIVGSIGLVLAVPLTTLIAAWYFGTHEVDETTHSHHGHVHTH